MKTCRICGGPAPEGDDLCWGCRHTKLHPTDPKPETEENEPKQKECASHDHYEAIRHEFYQVWECIEDLQQEVEQKKRRHQLAEFISKRTKKWIQQLKSH